MQEPSLDLKKHAKYFQLCLTSLPSSAQGADSNKLALVYFCLHGLALTSGLNFSSKEKQDYAGFILDHLIKDPHDEIQSFRQSLSFKLEMRPQNYDLPNLSATLFALYNLLILECNYAKILDRHKIMKFVQKCQVDLGPEKGAFVPALDPDGKPLGETDIRHCYIATSIRKLCKYDRLPYEDRINDINVENLKHFLLDRLSITGGFSSLKYTEPHLGLTFCALATFRLLEIKLPQQVYDTMVDFLCRRQVDYPKYTKRNYECWESEEIGGFNGRTNKSSDACYSWWCTASLCMLDRNLLGLVNIPSAVKFLLHSCQNQIMGGFAKDSYSSPDPLHSYLALASLALWSPDYPIPGVKKNYLQHIDESLVITKELKSFFETFVHF